METHSSILSWETRSRARVHGVTKESDKTEQLNRKKNTIFKIPCSLLFTCVALTQIFTISCQGHGNCIVTYTQPSDVSVNIISILSIPCISFFFDFLLPGPKHYIILHEEFHNPLLKCLFNLMM